MTLKEQLLSELLKQQEVNQKKSDRLWNSSSEAAYEERRQAEDEQKWIEEMLSKYKS